VKAASTPTDDLTGRDVAALLASTLGWEKSEELVGTVATKLGLDPARLDPDQAIEILDMLSRQQGIVGVTARFARSRCDSLKRASQSPPKTPPPRRGAGDAARSGSIPAPPPEVPSSQVVSKRLPISELVALLAPTIGQEKSAEAITAAARASGITEDRLTQEQALGLFEVLASHDGLVGVTARFAKARLVLRFRA
jgi:hypothetical protein